MAPSETEQIKAITDTDVENARLMLVHAAKTGMDLPKDMLLTLTAAIEGARTYDGKAGSARRAARRNAMRDWATRSLRCCSPSRPTGCCWHRRSRRFAPIRM
jgi:hypothetical protein